ncbi:MAG: glucosamine-6-phosphate deaminase [Pirellulaceae bacterium]
MKITLCKDKQELGRRAASEGAEAIQQAIAARGQANVTVATGASQFEMLAELVKAQGIEWGKVVFFHLDEYPGMPETHPASFKKYLTERLVRKLPMAPKAFHFIDSLADPAAECRRVGEIIKQHPIDVAFIGIGENGHLAFNDPPADFATEEPFILATLDEPCRRQQFGEGWFATLKDVPRKAISMSIREIMKAATLICSVPDARKAKAVKAALEGPVTPLVPASILQQHGSVCVYLDPDSAALLSVK